MADLPDFEDPAWNDTRENLEAAVLASVRTLLNHTGAGGGVMPVPDTPGMYIAMGSAGSIRSMLPTEDKLNAH